MKNILGQCFWVALLGLSAGFSFAQEASDVRAAWLAAKLYGHDNDGAALRRVTISEKAPGQYTVWIENQFGFQCDLKFGRDGHPQQLSACVSEDARAGAPDSWRVQRPDVIDLVCSKLAKEIVCAGTYTLATASTEMDDKMVIAMPRSALPQTQAGLIDQPTLAQCTANQVNIRSEPATTGEVIGRLEAGRVVLIGAWNTGGEGAWYKIDLPKEKGSGWVFGDYIAIPDAPTPDLAQILLDFGDSPAKAQSLFGPPKKIAQTALETHGNTAQQETLFYPEHQAVYIDGRLSRVVLEAESALGLSRWKLGQSAASLSKLGDAQKKGNEWTFMISPSDHLRFKIRQDKIAGAEYFSD